MYKFLDFNKLHTFIVATEYLSFSQAAQQLNVSQAAVSQQIRSLEDKLGFKLFHRITRGLTLTGEGEVLLENTQTLFSKAQETVASLQTDELSGILTVSILPSLAMKWLIPRLEKFSKEYPDINIHVHSHTELANFKTDRVDMAIRFGYQFGVDEKFCDTRLMEEEVFLVASPQLLAQNKPITQPSDLLDHVLIHDEVDCHYDAYDVHAEIKWDIFSKLLGVDVSQAKKIILTGAYFGLQAAIEGQGIAIARSVLVADDLAEGRLVRLFDGESIASPGYHIVYPKHFAKRKKIKLFEKWLLNEANT